MPLIVMYKFGKETNLVLDYWHHRELLKKDNSSGIMAASTKDAVLGASLLLSVVSLVLLFGVTWYFQSSLSLLQQQVEYDRELLLNLQEQVKVLYDISSKPPCINDINKLDNIMYQLCQSLSLYCSMASYFL